MSQSFEKRAVAKSFGDAATQYDEFARIQYRLADELLAMCPQQPLGSVLDLGCGTGYCLPKLADRYPQAKIVGADLSQGMLDHAQQHFPAFDYVLADAEDLPFEANKFDLVFSNLAVQWCDDIANVLSEVQRVLKPGGWFIFTNLADGTLQELKQAWASVDDYQHVNEFPLAQQLAQKNKQSDFDVVSFVCEPRIQFYQTLRALTDSLKRVGAHNMTQGRSKTLTPRADLKRFAQAMEACREVQGLPARYQVAFSALRKPL